MGRLHIDNQTAVPGDVGRYVDEESRSIDVRSIGVRTDQFVNRFSDNVVAFVTVTSSQRLCAVDGVGLHSPNRCAVEISDRMTGWTRFQTDPDDPVHPVNNLPDDQCTQMRSKMLLGEPPVAYNRRECESDWPTHTCRDAPRNHEMHGRSRIHLG